MLCSACGAQLLEDARFCTRCGARVDLGDILGVGIDLGPVAPAGQHSQHPQHPSQHAHSDGDQRPGGAAGQHRLRAPATFTVGRVAAMIATFVVLTILGTWTLSQLFGPDEPAPSTAASSAVAQGNSDTPAGEPSATSDSSPAPSPTEPSPTGSSPTPSPSPANSLPATARRCSSSGSDVVATAYSGNRDTSCAFTNAVRTAYREAGAGTNPAPFRTYSTVTKRWYDVTCDAATPVRCASADQAAVVFLGP